MHGSSNADVGGLVSLLERPNHTTRMVRPTGVLEIMHYCLITRVHTTTHFVTTSRHSTTHKLALWRLIILSGWVVTTRGSRQGIPQYTGASHGGRLRMAQQHSQRQKSPNHHNGHQHGSGARGHDHGTTTYSDRLTPRATNQELADDHPDDWRATSREPSRPVRFPERW